MKSKIVSAAQPTGLRVAGLLCVALGAVLAGIGATRAWVAVGFATDTKRAAQLPVHGIDVWEGKVALFAAAASLLVLIAMRISGFPSTRRGLAIVIIVVGGLCVALPVFDALRAHHRFGDESGLDRYATFLASRVRLPEDVVRDQLAEQFRRDLRVEVSPGLWLTVAGGVLLAVGGALGVAWSRREPTHRAPVDGP